MLLDTSPPRACLGYRSRGCISHLRAARVRCDAAAPTLTAGGRWLAHALLAR